ncbi:MAG: hypothetical protein ACRYHA_24645 [Janthinobacterium lividum]
MNSFSKSLGEIGVRHGSDKFTRHRFESVYERFMSPLRDQPLRILEIGIGGEDIENGGGSLLAWQEYFPNAEIYGIDIHDKSFLDSARVKTFLCSQTDRDGLNRLCDEIGPFDIVIDDGSHKGPDVSLALFTLFPRLKPGGIYFIEDVQTSYWAHYAGSSLAPECYDTATRWIKLCVDLINRNEMLDARAFPLAADIDVSELHVFHNIAALVRRPENVSLESRILNDQIRREFLQIDRARHDDIAEIHAQIKENPEKLHALLQRVAELGGLEKFLAA